MLGLTDTNLFIGVIFYVQFPSFKVVLILIMVLFALILVLDLPK